MKALAEDDGDVFLPNPEPLGTVQYVLICMELAVPENLVRREQARSAG
jgi:hypothetical protein